MTTCPKHLTAHRITRRRCKACCALEERAPIKTCTGHDRGHPERRKGDMSAPVVEVVSDSG